MRIASIVMKLAWRNLWRNHRRTLIMLAAFGVGIWAMIFMTALMRGMVNDMVRDGIRALPGHVQIHNPAFRDDPSIDNLIPAPSVAFAAALDETGATWTSRVRVPAVITSEREGGRWYWARSLCLKGRYPDLGSPWESCVGEFIVG